MFWVKKCCVWVVTHKITCYSIIKQHVLYTLSKMQTMPNGYRRAGLRPGTPCPSAGQCRPTAGHSVPSAPVQANAGLRPALPCPSAGRAGLRPGTPCPSAGLRPSAGTPSPQCRPVPAFGLQPALRASIVHQCRPCFRVPNAPSHRVHVQASAALPLPA